MASKSRTVNVPITADADFSSARADIEQAFARVEADAKRTADEIESAFGKTDIDIDPDLEGLRTAERSYEAFRDRLGARGVDVDIDVPVDQIQEAFDLARRLDQISADVDINTDTAQLEEATRLARSLRNFVGRVELDVEGRSDLRDALGLAESMDRIRRVQVQVRGQDDLARARRAAEDIEGTRTVRVDARAEDLVQLAEVGEQAGSGAADGFERAFGAIDLSSVGGTITSQLGALGATGGPLAALAAGVGALFADEIASGLDEGLNQRRTQVELSIATGLSGPAVGEIGAAAGDAYFAGFGESLEGNREIAAALQVELGRLDDDLDLGQATRQITVLIEVLGQDFPQVLDTTASLVTQFGYSTDEALNLITDSSQRLGTQAGEGLDVFREFAPFAANVGVDGATSLDIMSTIIEERLLPNASRAGELFEEFSTSVRTSDQAARDAIESIGLNFEAIQRGVAESDPRALVAVAEALQAVGSDAERERLAVDIFKVSMEGASDPERVLELLAQADAIGEIGTASNDAVTQLGENRTAWDELTRSVEEGAGWLGRAGDVIVASELDGSEAQTRLFADAWNQLTGALTGADSVAEGLVPRLADLAGELEVSELAADGAADAGGDAADAFGQVEESAADAAVEVDALREAFSAFNGFGYDQTIRAIYVEADRLVESLANAEGAVFASTGAIDQSTDAGRTFQESLEGIRGEVQALTESYLSDEISAAQYREGLRIAEEQFGRVTDAAGATQDQVADLGDEYLDLPDEVETVVRAKDEATSVIDRVRDYLDELPSRKDINLFGRVSGFVGTAFEQRATGGMASGLTLVGEEGPELVDFANPARVYSATDTRDLLAAAQQRGATATAASIATPSGGPLIQIDNMTVRDGADMYSNLELLAITQSARRAG